MGHTPRSAWSMFMCSATLVAVVALGLIFVAPKNQIQKRTAHAIMTGQLARPGPRSVAGGGDLEKQLASTGATTESTPVSVPSVPPKWVCTRTNWEPQARGTVALALKKMVGTNTTSLLRVSPRDAAKVPGMIESRPEVRIIYFTSSVDTGLFPESVEAILNMPVGSNRNRTYTVLGENFFGDELRNDSRFTPLAIGVNSRSFLGQRDLFRQLACGTPEFNSKPPRAYANVQFSTYHQTDSGLFGDPRKVAKDELAANPAVEWAESRTSEREFWETMQAFAFVISPMGHGFDCHRTWEALWMSSVPIVKTSPIDALYDSLPVVIVDTWSQITESNLKEWQAALAHIDWDAVHHKLSVQGLVSSLVKDGNVHVAETMKPVISRTAPNRNGPILVPPVPTKVNSSLVERAHRYLRCGNMGWIKLPKRDTSHSLTDCAEQIMAKPVSECSHEYFVLDEHDMCNRCACTPPGVVCDKEANLLRSPRSSVFRIRHV